MAPEWRPSRQEQRALFWVDLAGRLIKNVMRLVGIVGVVYTMFVKPDPIGMLVSGAMGTGIDIGQFAIGLFRAAREEAKQIEKIAHEHRAGTEHCSDE